jgi:NAD(P)-dependent dehydrogenase (short-subunit alcohol dehydrogenase family)
MVYALAKEGASMVVVDRNMDVANAVVTNVEEQGGKAIDLAPKNIRVNGTSPGMIASPFNQRFS